MTFTTLELLKDLQKTTQMNQSDLNRLILCSEEELNKRSHLDSWSALECLAHLNIYSAFYIPEIKKNLEGTKYKKPTTQFKSGILGNYFVKMVGPIEHSKKMKTLTSSNPIGSDLSLSTLQQFGAYQEQTLEILENASTVDIARTKCGISIAPWLKIKLGDALRVVIMHNRRHMIQALKAAELS
ncbi:DinB family protein [Lutimonas sp.]|uniref:DinB family protein n=1 Tax=Lutimonas sp. TaxID=1872403 RepID=UPI003D9AC8C2